MASHAMSAGEGLLDVPPQGWIVQKQRRGDGPVFDSWHDSGEEAYAQVDFLTLDREVEACVLPPPGASPILAERLGRGKPVVQV